jgi:hypothetical protein
MTSSIRESDKEKGKRKKEKGKTNTPGVRGVYISMEKTFWQKVEGTTDQIGAELKRLIAEGNVRRVVVKQRGRTVAEFPLTVGVVGAVLAPVAAAIGALTALLTECTIEVERAVAPAAGETTPDVPVVKVVGE